MKRLIKGVTKVVSNPVVRLVTGIALAELSTYLIKSAYNHINKPTLHLPKHTDHQKQQQP